MLSTQEERRFIAIADIFTGLLTSLGFIVVVATLYLRIVDDWLEKKEEKIEDVRAYKTTLLLDTINATCEINTEFNELTDDAAMEVRDFSRLLQSAKEVDHAVDEYRKWNEWVPNTSISMRKSLLYWVLFIFFANIANVISSFLGNNGFQIQIGLLDMTWIILIVFALLSIASCGVALLPLGTMLKRLNELDEESIGLQSIRTWESRK